MVFEVDGSGLTDLIGDGGFSDETEDGEGEVRLGGGGGERGFGMAAGFRERRESVEEAFGEELESLLVPFHGECAIRVLC